jgi:N-methylhydantoinase A/oxoprolinase/acetone carboxylase beta subunit
VRREIRYAGTHTTLSIPFDDRSVDGAKTAFEAAHKAQFGFVYDDKPFVVEAVNVEGVDARARAPEEPLLPLNDNTPEPHATRPIFCEGEWRDAGVFLRANLSTGSRVAGPALVIEAKDRSMGRHVPKPDELEARFRQVEMRRAYPRKRERSYVCVFDAVFRHRPIRTAMSSQWEGRSLRRLGVPSTSRSTSTSG